jgi:hypothetical protein
MKRRRNVTHVLAAGGGLIGSALAIQRKPMKAGKLLSKVS